MAGPDDARARQGLSLCCSLGHSRHGPRSVDRSWLTTQGRHRPRVADEKREERIPFWRSVEWITTYVLEGARNQLPYVES